MRLLLTVCAIALASSSADAAPPTSQPSKTADCPATSRYQTAQRDGGALFSRLGDLPAADAYKAVWRHDGRCEAPIIVRYGIGAPSRAKAVPKRP